MPTDACDNQTSEKINPRQLLQGFMTSREERYKRYLGEGLTDKLNMTNANYKIDNEI